MKNNQREKRREERFLKKLRTIYNEETVQVIQEAVEHPETLHELKSWEDLDL